MEKEKHYKIPDIIIRELNQEINNEEKKLLNEWFNDSEQNVLLYHKIRKSENLQHISNAYNSIDKYLAWKKVNSVINQPGFKHVLFRVLKYAAIISIPVLLAGYFLQKFDFNKNAIPTVNFAEQINTLEESSIITANGDVIVLDNSNDSIIEIDGTQIAKEKSLIQYKENQLPDNVISYNTLVTPKGKLFSIVFSDGTKVWLNAGSAIKYPTQFTSKTREVYLTGEAYFDVNRNENKPFIVSLDNMDIEVLGTSFNVMAYSDDNIVATTLVEGSVKVKTKRNQIKLKPGEQVRLDRDLNTLESQAVNTELYTSWMDGKYIFDYANLESVMTKLSRWYDKEIFYLNPGVKEIHFSGTLHKYDTINETLNIISLTTKVKFEINENTVLVMSK